MSNFTDYIGTLVSRKYDEVQLILVFCQLLNSQFSKPAGLNSSINVYIVNLFLSKIGFFVEVICCMFDQSFFHFSALFTETIEARLHLLLDLQLSSHVMCT